ncbi:MAG TPA: hypothetical protein VGL99_00715 [Chloroflexota bacterium]
MPIVLASRLQVRALFFVLLAVICLSSDTSAVRRTLAFFTAGTTQAGNMSTVRLDVSTSAVVSGLFSVSANMVPGDFQLKTIDIVNGGTSGQAQQDFTYSVTSTSSGPGNTCSRLDSSDAPTCVTPALPGASSATGAALVLLRCTSDAAAAAPVTCASPNVYVTQAYPAAGQGTQTQLAGGLSQATVGGVASDPSYSISIGGASFTGGPLVINAATGLGGPDSVAGADGQAHGLAANHTDHLASVVYLPRQAGEALADQSSVLTFTWTVTQRLGRTR